MTTFIIPTLTYLLTTLGCAVFCLPNESTSRNPLPSSNTDRLQIRSRLIKSSARAKRPILLSPVPRDRRDHRDPDGLVPHRGFLALGAPDLRPPVLRGPPRTQGPKGARALRHTQKESRSPLEASKAPRLPLSARSFYLVFPAPLGRNRRIFHRGPLRPPAAYFSHSAGPSSYLTRVPPLLFSPPSRGIFRDAFFRPHPGSSLAPGFPRRLSFIAT